ncbi:MAG: desulfoferrodoxin [Eubacterium sp.]|nr:desulfoferrodoxin [Eubacterium sp.]MDD7210126.1 desulfoferrodoxin family protein [Lachnospiraceae bacterium]MDY5496500.1 desulfoferrodoxin family protein [Anaerobutyricum sp.]
MEWKISKCEVCGKMIVTLKDSPVPTMCCGKPMTVLVPGTTDAAVEKHVPAVTVEGNKVTVKVGSVEHPMLPEHFIEWIAISTKEGGQIKKLNPGEKPEAVFYLAEGDEFVSALEYCNLHGLWEGK